MGGSNPNLVLADPPAPGWHHVEVCNFELNCGGEKNTPPTIRGPRDLKLRAQRNGDTCGRVVTDAELGQPKLRDNCGRVTITRTGVPAGNLFPVGTTVVTWTATDAGGQVASARQTVRVVDSRKGCAGCKDAPAP